jgi:hypothetical protein
MIKIFQNKRAVETLLSIWWFFVIALIGLGIVVGVLMFYSTNIDARGIEASIMSEKIVDCISHNGMLNESLLVSSDDIISFCKFNKEFYSEKGFLYFSIKVFDSGKLIKEISSGLAANEKDCQISSNVKTTAYPVCVQKKETMIAGGKNVDVVVLSSSNQIGGQGNAA